MSLLVILLVTPLISAALIGLFLRKQGAIAAGVSVLAAAVIAGLTLVLTYGLGDEPITGAIPWIQLGDWELSFGFLFDPLAAMMLFVVGVVGLMIHIFSLGYMQEDKARARYFGGLSIFMFSMLGIVLADNLFLIFVFWELVGFSSFLLISHYGTPAAAAASRKAFVVNRVGDLGFLLGILWVYHQFGTTSLTELAELAPLVEVAPLMGLLLFCGVLGKSAQVPLQVWLPDAMEGPTPVSALIHAATMVAAGVYFLGRTVFLYAPDALWVIAALGTFTAIYAAVCAFGQNDIKKILAFSTLSQLGYMVAAFGVGTIYGLGHGDGELIVMAGVAAAMFHLFTHAFFKALLFLGSGAIIHANHHEQDIFRYGGLLKKMPWTSVTFFVATIALVAIPYLGAGFFSKDPILYVAMKESPLVFGVLGFTALLTAAYMGRLVWFTFFGPARSETAEKAHEVSWSMRGPLVILAALTVLVVWVPSILPQGLQEMVHEVPHPKGGDKTFLVGLSAVLALGGLAIAWFIYRPGREDDPLATKSPALFNALKQRLYWDAAYRFYVDKIQQPIAWVFSVIDQLLIGGLFVRGSAAFASLLGDGAKSVHTGNLHAYVYWFLVGLVMVWLFLML